jgi:hypothetical protein
VRASARIRRARAAECFMMDHRFERGVPRILTGRLLAFPIRWLRSKQEFQQPMGCRTTELSRKCSSPICARRQIEASNEEGPESRASSDGKSSLSLTAASFAAGGDGSVT